MKGKWTSGLAGVVVLTMILLTGYQTVLAAPPTGELKSMAPDFGNEVPLPFVERGHALDWYAMLYDFLVGCGPDGKLSTELGLANKWEMSRDGLTWTFYLRKGVKFHDGVEVTAKDVKFSIELSLKGEATLSEVAYIRGNVQSVEAKDPYTVVFRCKQPAIFLASFLSNMESPVGAVLPKDYYEKVGKDGFVKHPIGSGPYKWYSQMQGSSIKLEATDRHWRSGIPRYKYMTYLIIPEESTRLAMLRTGEGDIARLSRGAVKEAMSAGLNIVNKEDAAVVVLHPNMQWATPAFSDIRFRKALNLAIDKESIIKNLFAGLAKPMSTYPGSNIVAVGGDPKLKPYSYDPQEATRLVKEGGWEGYEFTLMSYPRGGCPEFPLVIEALAGYWQKIGLNPKIRMTEWTVVSKAWNERKTQNTIFGYDDALCPDVYTLLGKFNDKWNYNFKSMRSTVNIPEVNERFLKIDKSMDIAEISKLMAEIYRIAYDQYLMIPVCEFPEIIATAKRIPKWDTGRRRLDRNYWDLIKQ